MQITFDTASQRELDAVAALIASLGGRKVPTALGELTVTGATPGSSISLEGDTLRETLPSEQMLVAAAERAAPAADGKPPLTTLDKSGVPWDARIHSSAQTINTSDGMWRSKRGIGEVEFGQIHAELQALYANPNATTGTEPAGTDSQPSPTVPTAPVAPTAPAAPPAPAPATDTSTGGEQAPLAPSAPSAPMAAAPPAPTAAASATGDGERWPTWAVFVQAVSALGQEVAGYANLNTTAGMFGVEKFASMKDHSDKWADFYEALGGQ